MAIRNVDISALEINRANDRHDELENETAAIAWLFNNKEAHMRKLTKDIVEAGRLYETPLVWPAGKKFIVYDGNRRVTCFKLLSDPKRAPSSELQEFFRTQRSKIDEILFRRHTGSLGGVGQSKWDDRQKAIFVRRTGKGDGSTVADEIEKLLAQSKLLPEKQIPRSTLNRLLSAEPFRNRLGFTMAKGKFAFTHDETTSMAALARVAEDLSKRKLVLGDIWDVDGKRGYLDKLEKEGVLPTADHSKAAGSTASEKTKPKAASKPIRSKPQPRTTLIPQIEFGIAWPGRLERHRNIWNELQWDLNLADHKNAISVLLRVLLELSVENYLNQTKLNVGANDKLAAKVLKIGKMMKADGLLDEKQLGMINKFQHSEQIVSSDTLNRYVHSSNFAPSPDHLKTIWDSFSDFIVLCLKA
jgi:hypothetical protein